MLKYTITLTDGNKEATAYIETARPLIGDEPVIKTRLAVLVEMTEPEDEYTTKFKEALKEKIHG